METKKSLIPIYELEFSDGISLKIHVKKAKTGILNPLAELNKRIFKSANRFVVNVVYILKDCKCTYFGALAKTCV